MKTDNLKEQIAKLLIEELHQEHLQQLKCFDNWDINVTQGADKSEADVIDVTYYIPRDTVDINITLTSQSTTQ